MPLKNNLPQVDLISQNMLNISNINYIVHIMSIIICKV